jgi:hypothetical protein
MRVTMRRQPLAATVSSIRDKGQTMIMGRLFTSWLGCVKGLTARVVFRLLPDWGLP